jgi:hypothetical protein
VQCNINELLPFGPKLFLLEGFCSDLGLSVIRNRHIGDMKPTLRYDPGSRTLVYAVRREAAQIQIYPYH